MGRQDLPEIPPNSHKSKGKPPPAAESGDPPTRPEIKAITQGSRPKQSVGSKFKQIFIADTAGNITNAVLVEVVYPRLRRLLFDTGNAALERTFLGGGGSGNRNGTDPYEPREGGSGSRRYSKEPSRRDPRDNPGPRVQHGQRNSDGCIVSSREAAIKVLDTMDEILKIDGVVTAGLLYELAGVQGDPTDYSWGWSSLSRVEIRQTKDGWLIAMPPEESLR